MLEPGKVLRTVHPTHKVRTPLAPILALVTIALLTLSACGVAPGPDDARDIDAPAPKPTELAWESTDVGPVPLGGSTTVAGDGDEFVVTAAGYDIWGNEDSFHFAHVKLEGDVDIRARIDRLEGTRDPSEDWAKAGVMVRSSLTAGSQHALMSLSPRGDAEFIYRLEDGAHTAGRHEPGTPFPTWVRIVRTGTAVRGLISSDGTTWTEVGSTEIALSGVLYVGIAVTSANAEATTQAIVRGVAIGDQVSTLPPADDADQPSEPAKPSQPGPAAGQWVCPSEPLTPAFQPTFFVATNGSDANDGRAASRPFRTLQRAANAVGPGDVVWVRGGVYPSSVEFRTSGTASAPIVVESYPGECAIFDGAGLGSWDRVTLEGVSNMVLRNIVTRNSSSEGLLLSRSHSNVISNVRSYGHHTSGILNMNGNDNLFTYVIMHDNNGVPGDADGISISSGNGNRIDRCIAFRNSDDGVDTWRSTNSVVERCISFENGYGGGDGNGFKAGGMGETVNTIVRYSIAFGNLANGFDNNTGYNVRFDHNTAFNNRRTGFVGSHGTVRNNLSIGNGTAWAGNESSQTTNSWNLGIAGSVFANTSMTHPDFLRLSPSSSAIAAGTPIGLPYSGAAPDLGALPLGQSIASFIGASLGTLPNY